MTGGEGDKPGPVVFARSEPRQPVSLRRFAVTVTSGQFIWAPHLRSMEEHLQAVADGEAPHETTLVLEPPRSGKSWLGCRIFPAYYMYRWPDRKVIVGAHTGQLASRHALVALIYYAMTPRGQGSLVKGARQGGWWQTKQGGQCFAIGRETWVLGQGYDILLVDDPFSRESRALNRREQEQAYEWWNELARREEVAWKQKSDPRRILFQQRIATMDLAGQILEREHKRGAGITVIYQPALEPGPGEAEPEFPPSADVHPRAHAEPGESIMPLLRSTADLEERRRDDPVRFDAVYQQNPRSEADDMWFLRERLQLWPDWMEWPPDPNDWHVERRIRSWDLAFTAGAGDWTVGVRMWRVKLKDSPLGRRFKTAFECGYEWFLVTDDIVRQRVSPALLTKLIVQTAKADREFCEVSIPQDPAGGKMIARDLRMAIQTEVSPERGGYERSPRVWLRPERGSKADRAWRHKTLANRGQVFLLPAPWNGSYIDELTAFTGEAGDDIADDQVDAASGAVFAIAKPRMRLAPSRKR